MKLMTMAACLALIPWLAPLRPAPVVPADASPPVGATVTRAGEVVSMSLPSPHMVRFSAPRTTGDVPLDLDLAAMLRQDGRVVAARLAPFGEHGVAVALAIEQGEETEYRWLFTNGDPLRGTLLVPQPGTSLPWNADSWAMSGPLFTSIGERYRLADIHNPGGDSLELTFRRGPLQGVRGRSGELSVDERILHDVCPMAGHVGAVGPATMVAVERVAAVH